MVCLSDRWRRRRLTPETDEAGLGVEPRRTPLERCVSPTGGGPTIQVPWTYTRCILCLKDEPPTDEHIIPGQIGGKLVARFLCKPCNDRLGHQVEPTVKGDPAIRLAVEHLRSRLPDLAREILDGQSYVGHGEGGAVRGRFKADTFRVDSFRTEAGSIIQPTPDGRNHIAKVLRKQGNADEAVVATLERFDSPPRTSS